MNTLQEVKRRGRPPTRRILTPAENKGMQQEVKDNKQMMTETATTYQPFKSLPIQESKIKRIEKTLKEGQQDSLNEYDKNELEKEKRELKEWLQKHMVPKTHIGLQPQKGGVQDNEFRKAASFMSNNEMSGEFQLKAERYKYVCRELGHNEDSNLENIRPETL